MFHQDRSLINIIICNILLLFILLFQLYSIGNFTTTWSSKNSYDPEKIEEKISFKNT